MRHEGNYKWFGTPRESSGMARKIIFLNPHSRYKHIQCIIIHLTENLNFHFEFWEMAGKIIFLSPHSGYKHIQLIIIC